MGGRRLAPTSDRCAELRADRVQLHFVRNASTARDERVRIDHGLHVRARLPARQSSRDRAPADARTDRSDGEARSRQSGHRLRGSVAHLRRLAPSAPARIRHVDSGGYLVVHDCNPDQPEYTVSFRRVSTRVGAERRGGRSSISRRTFPSRPNGGCSQATSASASCAHRRSNLAVSTVSAVIRRSRRWCPTGHSTRSGIGSTGGENEVLRLVSVEEWHDRTR